jgi:hypothetical protein
VGAILWAVIPMKSTKEINCPAVRYFLHGLMNDERVRREKTPIVQLLTDFLHPPIPVQALRGRNRALNSQGGAPPNSVITPNSARFGNPEGMQ